MDFIKQWFSPTRQRVIEAVRNYYDGRSSQIPYTSRQISETIKWVEASDIEQKEMLLEKLTMVALIQSGKHTKAE